MTGRAENPGDHQPVLLQEALTYWPTRSDGVYLDGTFGRGGHARALLARLDADARLLVIDRDPLAVAEAERLAAQDARVSVHRGAFGELARVLPTHLSFSGVLFDFGVSSPQLDDPARGFSFLSDGPLDMRMDPSTGPTAAEWLNTVPEAEMARVFREYGEERFAGRIARAIVRARPLETTLALAQVVQAAQPSRTPGKHGATRVFQAVRIQVNDELGQVEAGLGDAFERLEPGGHLVAISFHSLEDRIVKRTFRGWTQPEQAPRRLPTRTPVVARARKLAGPVRASARELAQNPRARSATLRAVERVEGVAP